MSSIKDDPNFKKTCENIKFIAMRFGMTIDEAADYALEFTLRDPNVNVKSMRGTFDIIREHLLEENEE